MLYGHGPCWITCRTQGVCPITIQCCFHAVSKCWENQHSGFLIVECSELVIFPPILNEHCSVIAFREGDGTNFTQFLVPQRTWPFYFDDDGDFPVNCDRFPECNPPKNHQPRELHMTIDVSNVSTMIIDVSTIIVDLSVSTPDEKKEYDSMYHD